MSSSGQKPFASSFFRVGISRSMLPQNCGSFRLERCSLNTTTPDLREILAKRFSSPVSGNCCPGRIKTRSALLNVKASRSSCCPVRNGCAGVVSMTCAGGNSRLTSSCSGSSSGMLICTGPGVPETAVLIHSLISLAANHSSSPDSPNGRVTSFFVKSRKI